MSKRRQWYESEQCDEYGHPIPPNEVAALPDKRDLEQRYKHLSEEVVGLRVLVGSQSIQLASALRRIRALEAHSVLDLIPE
jgi:hypothetical protein